MLKTIRPPAVIRLILLSLVILVSGCASTQIEDIKPGQKPSPDSDSGGLWFAMEKAENQIQNSNRRIRDPALNQYVSELVCKIAGRYCADIRVYIVDVPYFNASMAPNGLMIVWSGLLLRAQTEDQLAFILGHEIGHYVKQHSLKRWRQIKNVSNVMLGVSLASPLAGQIGNLAAIGAILKYSRDHERESDDFGKQRLAQLGMSSTAGAQIFTIAQQESDALDIDRGSIYFSSHPSDEERIKNLGGSSNLNLNVSDKHYSQLIRPHYPKWLKREVAKRSYNSSEVVLNRLATIYPDDATISYFQAELYRRRNDDDDLSKAGKLYQRAIDNGYSDPAVYKKLANLNVKKGNKQAAIENFKKYLEYGNLDTTQLNVIETKILNLSN